MYCFERFKKYNMSFFILIINELMYSKSVIILFLVHFCPYPPYTPYICPFSCRPKSC